MACRIIWMGLLSGACAFISDNDLNDRLDADGDLYISQQFGGEDCDDSNPDVFPGANEIPYDGIDQNCDKSNDYDVDGDGLESAAYGGTDCDDYDEAVGSERLWFADLDGDGFGDAENISTECEAPRFYLAWADDCDDTSSEIHPDAEERCDSIDNNCDGEIDEDTAVDAQLWYRDADEDGFGSPDETYAACQKPEGYLSDRSDCLDSDETVNILGTEICNDHKDNDCNGSRDNCLFDGFGYAVSNFNDGFSNLELEGEAAANSNFGWWAGGIGDVDGDGVDDLLVSAPLYNVEDSDEGKLYFWRGASGEDAEVVLDEKQSWTSDMADKIIENDAAGTRMGGTVAPLGDIDNDGFDDVMIGACSVNGFIGGTSNLSSVIIEMGSDTFWEDRHVRRTYQISGLMGSYNLKASIAMGCPIANAGDTDGDGNTDVLISSPGMLTEVGESDSGSGKIQINYGEVYLFYGPITANTDAVSADLTLISDSLWGTDLFGGTVAGNGDMNADGVAEMVIGAMAGEESVGFGAGAVYLAYGSTDGRLVGELPVSDAADAVFNGDATYAKAGEVVDIDGDINGDGYSDMLITSSLHSNNQGMIYIKLGKAAQYVGEWNLWNADVRLWGRDQGHSLGISGSIVPDVDGDGVDDLWVGAAGQQPSERAYLVYGPLNNERMEIDIAAATQIALSEQTLSVPPNNSRHDGNVFVQGAGDFNGDGYQDLVAAFPWFNDTTSGTTRDGRVFLFLGQGY